MSRTRELLVALACVVALVPSCRAPTEIAVVVSTDEACANLRGTSVTVGNVGEIEDKAATTSSTFCDASGDLGTLEVVPSGGRSDEIALKIVAGVGRDADSCVPPYGKGCIVARRAIHFLPHTALRIVVRLRTACDGVICAPDDTCVSGACVSAAIADPSACAGATGCDEGALATPPPAAVQPSSGLLRRLTITNGATAPLPVGYTIRVPLDDALVSAALASGKVRPDYSDLRVVAGSRERDRLVDVAPLPAALRFSLAAPIAPGATDTTYALAYGAVPSLTAAANGANVFALYDDFASAAVQPLWVTQGSLQVSGGLLTLVGGTSAAITTVAATDGLPATTAVEIRARVPNPQADGTTYRHWFGFQRAGDFVTSQPWINFTSLSKGTITPQDGAGCVSACQGPSLPESSDFHTYGVAREPTRTRFFLDDTSVFDAPTTNDQDLSPQVRNLLANGDVIVDWVRARPLVVPEPTVALGAEQSAP